MTIFYLDYENGNDSNDGSSWANAWRTFTNGATAARIAPGDIIRIAKSPAPVSIGNATWNNLSKTVTLATAQTATIDLCDSSWTSNPSGDILTGGGSSTRKEGVSARSFVFDSSIQTNIMQAYYATGTLDLSAYQKISLWFRNASSAVVANNFTITLCSDTAGAVPVDTFDIPAIPSTSRYLPLTLARNGGGNLGSSIQSIAINTGSVAPAGSISLLIDCIIACTTDGLSLQSLISKNSAEQGGAEGWYGIQSIDGTTILLDNETNTDATAGRGYYGTTETVTTYKRETIKTDLAAAGTTIANDVTESGTSGSNIEFQGGYDTGTGNQTGETFFDGLNGNGYGIRLGSRSYVTLNRLNTIRYSIGIYFNSATYNTITTLSNANNNSSYGIQFSGSYNNTVTTLGNVNNNSYGMYITTSSRIAITTLGNINNNASCGVYLSNSSNNTIITLSNVNNSGSYGVLFSSSSNNTITTLSNANNNATMGVYFTYSSNNTITTISTSNNGIYGVGTARGYNYIKDATISETTKIGGLGIPENTRVFIQNIGGYSNIWADGGNIISQDATAGGSGIEWSFNVTNSGRNSDYPLDQVIAKVAVAANAQVTVTCYFKKSHATAIAGKLVCRGGQLAGVTDDVVATCPDDTNRNQLSIQFTPTEAGVIEIEAWAYHVSSTAIYNVIIDDIAISQA